MVNKKTVNAVDMLSLLVMFCSGIEHAVVPDHSALKDIRRILGEQRV